MSETNNEKKEQKKKCSLKCKTCEHYNGVADYCKEKGIKHCSEQIHTDFSTCDTYLISSRLVMF